MGEIEEMDGERHRERNRDGELENEKDIDAEGGTKEKVEDIRQR